MEPESGRAVAQLSTPEAGTDHPGMFKGGILALDIARVTGWCAVSRPAYKSWPLSALEAKVAPPLDHNEIRYGRQTMAPQGAELGLLFDGFHTWLRAMIEAMQPDWIVWEAPFLHRRRDTIDNLRRLHGPLAIVEMLAFQNEIRVREVPLRTAKKHVTGNGNADKSLMVDMIRARGFDPQDDNVADAIAVADTFIAWRRLQK